MQQRLRQILDGVATVEQTNLICEACQVLEDLNFHDHETIIEQTLASPEMSVGEVTFVLIENIFIPLFAEYLLAMGITLNEQCTLTDYKDVLFWVSQIDNNDDADIIYGLATGDDESEDTLAEILSVLSSRPAEDFAVMLDTVLDSLIDRIISVTEGKGEIVLPDSADVDRARARTIKLVDWLIQNDPMFASKFVRVEDLQLGMDPAVTVNPHRGFMEIQTDADCAKLLVLYLFVSDLHDTDIVPALAREVELIHTDLVRAMNTSKIAKKLLGQIGHA